MANLFDLDGLKDRLGRYVQGLGYIGPEAVRLLEEALFRDQLERGEASSITGLPPRSARRALAEVYVEDLPESDTPRGPVHLKFPTASLDILFPRLLPLA